MADKTGSIGNLFKDGRSRALILTTLFILLVAVIAGIVLMRGHAKGVPASAGLSQGPTNLQSVPFNAPNDEYARLQEKQNKLEADQANKTGTSAIPTIVRADSGLDKNVEPVSDTGLGFTGLKREQSDAGKFTAKEFGNNQASCPTTPTAVNTALGTPIYDKDGRLIGYAGADGKVRDVNGNIIGTLGPDGIVRDAKGNPIGQINIPLAGTPVYDNQGNLMGYTGPDGSVRDAAGHVTGTLGANGVLQDASGKIIGQTGTPVYGPDGKLLGYAGPDGKIHGLNGSIIGTVGPDGIARNLNGAIIGKAGAISPGTPIYGPDGKIIGYVGPDGKVRDANGNVIGTLGADGIVKDVNGNSIGSITPPPKVIQVEAKPVPLVGNMSKDTAANTDFEKQQAIMKDQALQQVMQQKQQSITSQANQLLSAWSPPSQQFVVGAGGEGGRSNNSDDASGHAGASNQVGAASNKGPVMIKAGALYYGVINTAVNSDEPGPIMATVISGPYKNGKLLGTLTNQGQAVMLSFSILTLPDFPKSISVNVVAIDQNTARTALSTETDNHYLLRFGSVFASAFLQGYGQAFQTSGSTITTNGLSTQSSSPDLSPQGKFFVALGSVGQQFSNQAQLEFNRPPTVHVASGAAVGLLFLSDVQMPAS